MKTPQRQINSRIDWPLRARRAVDHIAHATVITGILVMVWIIVSIVYDLTTNLPRVVLYAAETAAK